MEKDRILEKELLKLYRIYLLQSSERDICVNLYHDNGHDNSYGHPDYHNDSHDNTPSMRILVLEKNETD